MGNHEDLMAKAIQDEKEIPLWLYNGGEATLESYGLNSRDWVRAKDREGTLPGFIDFYDTLLLYHEDDHAIYVHAGLDVSIANLAEQDAQVLLWVRDKFFRNAAQWKGKPVYFGHTPTHTIGLPGGSIYTAGSFFGIDTGCVYGGCLTAIDTKTHTLYQEPSDWDGYRFANPTP